MNQKNMDLKKLLKAPFKWEGREIALSDYTRLQFHSQNLLNTDYLDFVIDALNEKAERDFGEPLRWIFEYNEEEGEYWTTCPECKKTQVYSDDVDPPDLKEQKYCSNCGHRVDPPEETT